MIGHYDLRERFGVQNVGFLDDPVAEKKICKQTIHLFRLESIRAGLGHGPVDKVPDGWRVGPEAANRLHGMFVLKRAYTSH